MAVDVQHGTLQGMTFYEDLYYSALLRGTFDSNFVIKTDKIILCDWQFSNANTFIQMLLF